MIYITFDLFLSVLKYLIYLLLVLSAAFLVYRGLSTPEERERHRMKLQKQIIEQQKKFVKVANTSELDKRLKAAGNPLGLTAARYEVIRVVFLVLIVIYYCLIPLIKGTLSNSMLLIPAIAFYTTMTTTKYAPASMVLNYLINTANRKRVIELFNMFDMLKSELTSLSPNQQVNVYGILKDSVSMFDYINVPVNKFLSLWKADPLQAKEVFSSMIGGESSEAIGDILYRLDKTSKEDALKIIEAESEVFSYQYYEQQLQNSGKRKTAAFTFYALSSVMVIIWLLYLMLEMTNDLMVTNTL